MSDVFVSYAGPDRDAARRILVALGAAGLSVSDDQSLRPGVDFGTEVEAAIDEAKCVLIVWSETAARTSWVANEMRLVMRAWSSDRLVLAALDDAALPVGLRDIPRVRVGDDAPGLVARVKAVVERTKDAASARSSAPRKPAHGTGGRGRALVAAFVATAVVGAAAFGYLATRKNAAPPKTQPEFHHVSPPEAAPPSAAPSPTTRPEFRPEARPEAVPPPAAPSPAPARPPGAPSSPGTGAAAGALEPQAVLIVCVLVVGVLIGAGVAWAVTARARASARRSIAAVAPQPAVAIPPGAANTGGGLQVFISYSHKDESVVDDLVRKIEAMGYPVWIDREAVGSARYAGQIVGAIRMSKLVALMCSKSAFASDHVIREVYVAGDLRKPFVAFQLDPSDFPDDILYFITGFPRIPVEGATAEALRAEFARAAGARR